VQAQLYFEEKQGRRKEGLLESTAPFTKREFGKAGVLALGGFVLCAAAIHATIRRPLRLYAAVRSEQLAAMDRMQGKYSSSAFGSSHVRNGFDPVTFDREMEGTPAEGRTENMAILGGSQVEQRAIALEYFKGLHAPNAAGARSCTVLLELSAGTNIGDGYMVHPRTINLYDWHAVRLVMGFTDAQIGVERNLGRVGFAIAGAAMYYMNVGMMSSRIFTPQIDERAVDFLSSDDHRGAALMATDPRGRAEVEQIIAAAPPSARAFADSLMPGNSALVDELRTAAPVHPIAFVYMQMPMLSDLQTYPLLPDHVESAGGPVPIINLERPDLHPELYQVQYWHDDAHLNDKGAALATAIMAEELKAWYAAHGWPSACEG
jgi:hypothetical protein